MTDVRERLLECRETDEMLTTDMPCRFFGERNDTATSYRIRYPSQPYILFFSQSWQRKFWIIQLDNFWKYHIQQGDRSI